MLDFLTYASPVVSAFLVLGWLVTQAVRGGATQTALPPAQQDDPLYNTVRDPGADHPPWCKCRRYHN